MEQPSASALVAGRCVVRVRGDQDIANVSELVVLLRTAIDRDARDILVNLGEVDFLGASTVRVLLQTRDELLLQQRSLTVRVNWRTRRLFVLLGLTDLLTGDET